MCAHGRVGQHRQPAERVPVPGRLTGLGMHPSVILLPKPVLQHVIECLDGGELAAGRVGRHVVAAQVDLDQELLLQRPEEPLDLAAARSRCSDSRPGRRPVLRSTVLGGHVTLNSARYHLAAASCRIARRMIATAVGPMMLRRMAIRNASGISVVTIRVNARFGRPLILELVMPQ